MSEVDMNFNRDSDVPPSPVITAGYYDAIVAGVKFEELEKDLGSIPQGTPVARVSYRIESEGEFKGEYVRPFPMPVRKHKDAYRWFAWCETMGYDTKARGGFHFSEDDVVNVRVELKFDAPKPSKDGTKMYDNLVSVTRKKD